MSWIPGAASAQARDLSRESQLRLLAQQGTQMPANTSSALYTPGPDFPDASKEAAECEEDEEESDSEEDEGCSGFAMLCGIICIVLYGAMLMFVIGCALIISVWMFKAYHISPGPPKACKTLPAKEGYPALQQRPIVTSDGVTLMMWRVPGNQSHPVLLLHGLESSSRDWFAGLDDEALPWLLSREGFDVWVGNSRGVFYSDTPHWDWTFEQMADYDMPAMVNGILADTGAPALRAFVGHSQGALQAFLHFSDNAETAQRVAYFAALSPAVYLTQQRYTWNLFSSLHLDQIVKVASARPGTSFQTFEELQRDLCYAKSWVMACWDCARDMGGSFMMGDRGFASSCYNKFECIPAGTSSDNLRAFADTLRMGSFQDYLRERGRAINFTALPMPISLAVGDSDLFMKPDDVKRIITERGPGTPIDFWELEGAGHMDLVWGTEAPLKVYRPLIERLNGIER